MVDGREPHSYTYIKFHFEGWRDDSQEKSTDCSFRDSELNSQQLHERSMALLQPLVIDVSADYR